MELPGLAENSDLVFNARRHISRLRIICPGFLSLQIATEAAAVVELARRGEHVALHFRDIDLLP